jgi:hypothetical protein
MLRKECLLLFELSNWFMLSPSIPRTFFLLFYHVEEATREYHSYENEKRNDDSADADVNGLLADELRSNFVTSSCVHVRECRIVLARFALNTVNLLAAGDRNFAFPVAECLNTAASQSRLRKVPCCGDLTTLSIQIDRRKHLLLHGELNFFAEHYGENPADQHRHEDQKQKNRVLQGETHKQSD